MINNFDVEFEDILLEEEGSKFMVTEASGMRWVNVKYKGTATLHGKLFLVFLDANSELLTVNVSYLSSISKISDKKYTT